MKRMMAQGWTRRWRSRKRCYVAEAALDELGDVNPGKSCRY
jgi:hypothetical protein